MATVSQKFEVKIFETIILSLLLHSSLLIIIPKMKLENIMIPEMLNVEIDLSSPQAPQQIEMEKKITPPVENKIEPIQTKEIEPIPIEEKVVEDIVEEEISPSPDVEEFIEEEIAEQAQEQTSSSPAPEIIQELTDNYTNQLTRAIAKQKKYPKIAQMRQWQGEVVLNIEINPAGNLIKVDIIEKSRHEILNTEAKNMVKRASPFPKPPEELQQNNFTVLVPISFKLE
jgi:protein TonB